MTAPNNDRILPLSEAVTRISAPSEDWLIRKLRARKLPGRKIARGHWGMTEGDIAESIRLLASPASVQPADPDASGLIAVGDRQRTASDLSPVANVAAGLSARSRQRLRR